MPVQIVPPGDVTIVSGNICFVCHHQSQFTQTGDDTETLRKVEARIQADFKNSLPPHLQPDSKNMEYVPGSGQSRIYVTSHSEFYSLHARDIQRILRDRLILVHSNPLDYDYGYNLESFGRVYDVDRQTSIQGEIPCPLCLTRCLNLFQFQRNFITRSLTFAITKVLCGTFII